MPCNVPPFASAVLNEASRLVPNRRTSSDGVCADWRHYQTGGDHVPSGPHNYSHAVDVSQSIPGAPFWESRFGQFDAHRYARRKAQDWVDGHGDGRIKYMVIGQPNGPDIIFDPVVSLSWRQNGSYKTEHRSHLHVSFTVAAEQSTAPFFVPEEDMPLTDADVKKVADEIVRRLGRQHDGTSGVIGDEVKNVLGGYSPGGQYVDGLIVTAMRKQFGLSKP